jgi:hypothetical protein
VEEIPLWQAERMVAADKEGLAWLAHLEPLAHPKWAWLAHPESLALREWEAVLGWPGQEEHLRVPQAPSWDAPPAQNSGFAKKTVPVLTNLAHQPNLYVSIKVRVLNAKWWMIAKATQGRVMRKSVPRNTLVKASHSLWEQIAVAGKSAMVMEYVVIANLE